MHVITKLLLKEIYPSLGISIWLNVNCSFTWWSNVQILLQQFVVVKLRIWACIDYYFIALNVLQANRLTKCAGHSRLTSILAIFWKRNLYSNSFFYINAACKLRLTCYNPMLSLSFYYSANTPDNSSTNCRQKHLSNIYDRVF